MNYLAHIFLAQPNIESVCGNLMGDFMKGVKIDQLPDCIARGVQNHRLVDRFTDSHPSVQALKKKLSPQRRRFSGVIADIVFDHLLIQYWSRYNDEDLGTFIELSHQRIMGGREYMNSRMEWVLMLMIKENWLHSYHTLEGVEKILERMANRIRFKNQLSGAMLEVENLISNYEEAFNQLFPELIKHVAHNGIESSIKNQ